MKEIKNYIWTTTIPDPMDLKVLWAGCQICHSDIAKPVSDPKEITQKATTEHFTW